MEYRSRTRFFGLPLVHIATGALVTGQYRRGVATGWLAVGDVALGVLFACGGVAVGGISLGGAALGVVPIGGFALGIFAAGGLSLGVVALGGAALAWYAAMGGMAVAHDYAIGGLAVARRAVSPLPAERMPFSSIPHAPFGWPDALLLAAFVTALLVLALALQARRRK